MALCRAEGIPVLPRGGGTSQCGQTVNRALVIDCTKYLRNVLKVEGETATVQPGITLGALNAALAHGEEVLPGRSLHLARCTIGGMAANNSCGSKSIRYGLMADNVWAIDALLADGTRFNFGELPDNLGGDMPAGIAELIQSLRALGVREAAEIAARFPDQLRRVGGYNIEALTPAARAAGRGNLARLLVGSEGTLAFSAALDLKLWPVKPRKVLGICQFPSFRKAMEASQHLVTLDPEAVELVDRTMIDLGRSIPMYRATIDRILIGEPDSLLIVEFHGHEDAPLLRSLDALEEMMADLGHPGQVVRVVEPGFQAAIAEVREAGLNIMMSMKGDGKPVSFIEDCAVALPDLADYTERLNDVFARYGSKGTWYAHASVGCLHVRPVLNMKAGEDVAKMRAIAEECFALVREYKGSHSGEHGDGIVRSEFHESMFGARIVGAFEQVKDAFDPKGLLNPGKITRAPRMDDRSLFRYGPDYAADPAIAPALDWSAWRDAEGGGPQGGLLGAVEMCNNNGTCRKSDANVMCPSFRATQDEQHLTRGRANTLRLALTGQLAGRPCLGRGGRRDGPLRLLQGVQAGMPDRRRHGQAEDRGPGRPRRRAWAVAEGPRHRHHAALGALRRHGALHPQCPRLGARPRLAVGEAAGLRRRPQPAALRRQCLPRRRAAGADGRGGRGHPLPRPLQPLLRAGEYPRRRPRAAGRRLPAGGGAAGEGRPAARQRADLSGGRVGGGGAGRGAADAGRRSAASTCRWSASSLPAC